MPLTLTVTEGLLEKGHEKKLFADLSSAMLKWHGLTGNKVLTPNVVGSIHLVPKEHSFAGETESAVVFIEWKVPSFAFSTHEIQSSYIREATDLVYKATNGIHPKNKVWVNIVHAVDGGWGINGEALTNENLLSAISNG